MVAFFATGAFLGLAAVGFEPASVGELVKSEELTDCATTAGAAVAEAEVEAGTDVGEATVAVGEGEAAIITGALE